MVPPCNSPLALGGPVLWWHHAAMVVPSPIPGDDGNETVGAIGVGLLALVLLSFLVWTARTAIKGERGERTTYVVDVSATHETVWLEIRNIGTTQTDVVGHAERDVRQFLRDHDHRDWDTAALDLRGRPDD